MFLEIGDGWRAAILNTSEEHDFLREGQKSFSDSVPYWIDGFTNFSSDAMITYTDIIYDPGTTTLRLSA